MLAGFITTTDEQDGLQVTVTLSHSPSIVLFHEIIAVDVFVDVERWEVRLLTASGAEQCKNIIC